MDYDMTLFTTIVSASASFVAIIGGFVASKLISINGERTMVTERISELDELIELKFADVEELQKELQEDDALEFIREHIDVVQEKLMLKDIFETDKPQRLEYEVLEKYWEKAIDLYPRFKKAVEDEAERNDDGIPVEIAIQIKNSDFEYNVCQLFVDYENGVVGAIKHGLGAAESNVEWYNEKNKTCSDTLRELGVLQLQREQLEKQKRFLIRLKKMTLGLWIFVIISIVGILIPLVLTAVISNFPVQIYENAQKISLLCMGLCLALAFGYLFSLLEWNPKESGVKSVKKTKKKYKKQGKINDFATGFKRVAMFFFIISIYLSVRWSDYPLIWNNGLFKILFEHIEVVDSAMLNLVTGYFTGYLVYIFTVVIPTCQRQKVVQKYACRKLISLYNDSIFLLFLMAKSASTESEWAKILSNSKDLDCFSKDFYDVIGKFDIQSPAETMFKSKKNMEYPIPWYDYLEYRNEKIYEELDDVFLRYHAYLDEGLIEAISEWKSSNYFDLILGKGNNTECFYFGENGTEYKENIPISMYCQQAGTRVAPIFEKKVDVDNADRIKEYVEILSIIYVYCQKSVQGKLIDADYTLNTFKKHNIGHIGSARM